MDESELLFNLFYMLLCMCVIYPPEEFGRLGLTIEKIFSRLLGNETNHFIRYHQRRTSLNLFVHSCLPAIYFLIHQLKFSVLAVKETEETDFDPEYPMPQEAVKFKTLTWKVAQRFSLMALLAVPALIFNWSQQNWRNHPISKTLVKFSNVPNSYVVVASDIGTEIRRPDIYKKKVNSIATVIATENWIIKTSMYNVHFAHQSDTALSVAKTETYNVTQDANDTLQMISIQVKANRQGVADFNIRINALDFRNLEDRISRPIVIPSNIQFHRNVIDRFIDAFKEQVAKNPIYTADLIIADKCFACMSAEPNIKIQKQCIDVDAEGRPLATDTCCSNCYCRPMWCVACLARWFAARQNDYDREVWLEQKCTCPMCRAKFCLLDVSYIERTTTTTNESDTTAPGDSA